MLTRVHAHAVVDKYGFLWTGSGAFLYNGTGTHTVLRFDTSITTLNDNSKPILAFAVVDESNVRTISPSHAHRYVAQMWSEHAPFGVGWEPLLPL